MIRRLDVPDTVICNLVPSTPKGAFSCADSADARRKFAAAYPDVAPLLLSLTADATESSVSEMLARYPNTVEFDYLLCTGVNTAHKGLRWIVAGPVGSPAPTVLTASFLVGKLELISWEALPRLSVFVQFAQIVDNPCAPRDSFR